ncbi:MAG: ATP-binding protein [Cyanobacteria bacterium J06621_3]
MMTQHSHSSRPLCYRLTDRLANGRFLSRLRVGPRVSAGFTIALGVAFIGALTGVVLGEQAEQQAYADLDRAIAQSQLLGEVESSFNSVSLLRRELIYLIHNPVAFDSSAEQLREKMEAFNQAFAAFQATYSKAELTASETVAYRNLVDEFEDFVRPYFRTTQLQLLQVESLSLSEGDLESQQAAQTLLLEANNGTSLVSAHHFIYHLQALSTLVEADSYAAADSLIAAGDLRRNIIYTSLLISMGVASVLAILISRSIVRPLRLVEQVAIDVTEQDRFDLQAPVTTEDEVATLARALNQLIANVRSLLAKEAQRTQALAQANEEIRATQTQMIAQEKLASLGSLTAGIAHEIKNPLNFVNNFAELSVDLVEELTEEIATYQTRLSEESCEEINDLLGLLGGNITKIERHGKRADKIVATMLMHSRNGSVEWSQVNINEVLKEAVNLAYHGMRAQHSDFNLAFDSDYDDTASPVYGCAQDLNRVFLNIINNACYAIYQRSLSADASFQPLLKIRTRDRDKHIEIYIRDNGVGIPPDIQAKIFNQFFTTKPTGEGTGLGLSLSHEIITQQHQGTLEVASEVGYYTDFIITLPKNIEPKSLDPALDQ